MDATNETRCLLCDSADVEAGPHGFGGGVGTFYDCSNCNAKYAVSSLAKEKLLGTTDDAKMSYIALAKEAPVDTILRVGSRISLLPKEGSELYTEWVSSKKGY